VQQPVTQCGGFGVGEVARIVQAEQPGTGVQVGGEMSGQHPAAVGGPGGTALRLPADTTGITFAPHATDGRPAGARTSILQAPGCGAVWFTSVDPQPDTRGSRSRPPGHGDPRRLHPALSCVICRGGALCRLNEVEDERTSLDCGGLRAFTSSAQLVWRRSEVTRRNSL
jgi:hypothetical protein